MRGVGAGRGGGEPGAGCLGTKQEAAFLVRPPWAPPIPVNFLQFCFPTQTACSTSLPRGAEAGKATPAVVEGFQGGQELLAFPSPEPQ